MNKRDAVPPKNPVQAAREKRLAEALRANLRRRKDAAEPRALDNAGGNKEDRPQSAGR